MVHLLEYLPIDTSLVLLYQGLAFKQLFKDLSGLGPIYGKPLLLQTVWKDAEKTFLSNLLWSDHLLSGMPPDDGMRFFRN